MKDLKHNLLHQLITITIIILLLIFFCLRLFLPKVLLPIYEKNIYQNLNQPISDVTTTVDDNFNEDIAYIYITESGIISSNNLDSVILATPKQILEEVNDKQGKFKFDSQTYYYSKTSNDYVTKITLTNDNFVKQIKRDILYAIFPIIFLTFLIILVILIWWSRNLVLKIERLKDKIDNLDNDEYEDKYDYKTDDELKVLSDAIDNMRRTIKEQDEYKNQMYQNISHDFKTPLTVIKSYIEAINDGVQDKEEGMKIIEEQVDKLELKVHSLLYLNKINYIKDSKCYHKEIIDIAPIIESSVAKFKIQRSDVAWIVNISDKKRLFNGTVDMWEAIIDNILNNFVRYAEKEIKVTVRNNRIIFYNDGPIIDSQILDDIFTPYKKGIKGQFGLGLSIVKKTVALLGYEISVKNEKKGVSFIIK